ncbi:MAG: helical backbone metal receptor [Bacteroidota bacterium]|nr:helical backbone metal receptor [Bacteroidota bacterium]
MMMISKNQTGRNIDNTKSKAIVSLVPSITELLFDLSLNKEVAAITNYCIYPKKEVTQKPKIGGPKDIDIQKILALNPDLIIASKEENNKQQVEFLMNHCKVYVSDVKNFTDALTLIQDIGIITHQKENADNLIKSIKNKFSELQIPATKRKRVAYLIWKNPYMTINNDTYIHHMLLLAGLDNVFADRKNRYPEITIQEIETQNPDYIFLSSEPYSFKDVHVHQFNEIFPNTIIKRVDGKIFSWYGSHLIKAPDYFKHLL